MLTLGNLASGISAILYCNLVYQDYFDKRVVFGLIILGALFDVFDGGAARALKVNSAIGGQLDSLADLVTFGIAPGVLCCVWFNYNYPQSGTIWLTLLAFAAVSHCICTAYRLATFNIKGGESDDFEGLPSPASGLFVASLPWLFSSLSQFDFRNEYIIPLILISSILMVFGWRFFSFKGIKLPIVKFYFGIIVVSSLLFSYFFGLGAVALGIIVYKILSLHYSINKKSS